MERLKAQIGWNGNNFEVLCETGDDVIVATGNSIEDTKQAFREAAVFHFEQELDSEGIGFVLRPSALLKDLDGIVKMSAIAQAGGLNERRLGHFKQGRREGNAETLAKIQEGLRSIIKRLQQAV